MEQGDNGTLRYQGRTFANADELISTLATPIPEPVTTPKVSPPDAVTQAAPKVTPADKLSYSAPGKLGRAAGNYLGKMAYGVEAAFANIGGRMAGAADRRREQSLHAVSDVLKERMSDYVDADETQKEKALKRYQSANKLFDSVRSQPETAKKVQESLYRLSDRLAEKSGEFQKAAEADTAPVLRPALDVVTDLVPFFTMNAVPVAGQALSGAYLVGESTREARRAGLSETSQAALGFAAVLSMGAAGQVGKALGSEKVVGWFQSASI